LEHRYATDESKFNMASREQVGEDNNLRTIKPIPEKAAIEENQGPTANRKS
jgi:hypothetical protein